MVALEHRELGEGSPVAILHGLFGSGRNWQTIGRGLGAVHRVLMPDARNHGTSAHAASMTYPEQAGDVPAWLSRLGLASCPLVGHSMGGKTAMYLALTQPRRVSRLVVVDIAPVAYPDEGEHAGLIEAMSEMAVARLEDRRQADEALAARVADPGLRAFLLQNLARRSGGGFEWKLNLPVLRSALGDLRGFPAPAGVSYPGPTLVLAGERSGYVDASGRAEIRRRFPGAAIETLADAGHWLHAEQPKQVVERIGRFLEDGPEAAAKSGSDSGSGSGA